MKEKTSRDLDLLHLNTYKKITALPKMSSASPAKPLTLAEKFIKEKVLARKVMTRRDITLNKIIIRNLVRNKDIPEGSVLFPTQVNASITSIIGRTHPIC